MIAGDNFNDSAKEIFAQCAIGEWILFSDFSFLFSLIKVELLDM